MIEVYKTNVQNKAQVHLITNVIQTGFSNAKINFDLEDCDKILRVDGIDTSYSQIIVDHLGKLGFKCEVLN